MLSRPKARARRILTAAAALVLVAAGVVVAESPAEAANGTYYDGGISYSQIVNCVSIIQSAPYTEKGAGSYVGAYADPDSGVPYVGQSFYVHVVVAGIGNACSGQRFVPGFRLPAGVALQQSLPILCYAGGHPATGAADCPQWSNIVPGLFGSGTFGYASSDTQHARLWPLPQGAMWEFQIPVIASSSQSGTNLQGIVRMADGNGNPDLTPSAPLYVFPSAGSGATQVIYRQPSTRAAATVPNLNVPSATGLYSEATVYASGVGGTIRLERGTSPGSYTQHHDFAVTSQSGTYGWVLDTDWDDPGYFTPLAQHTTYYWRVTFYPTSGSPVTGAQQSFSYPLGASSSTLTGGDPKTLPVVKPGNTPPRLYCHGRVVTVNLAKHQKPTNGNDVILGTARSEVIKGLGGNDVICAGGGSDVIDPGSGNDWVDGGSGTDTISYATASRGVTLSLAKTGAQRTGGSGTDTVVNVENAVGTKKADRITGSAKPNVLTGGVGNDVLSGGAGNDSLIGGAGSDKLSGGSGSDKLSGGSGRDRCTGGAGRDRATSCEIRSSVP